MRLLFALTVPASLVVGACATLPGLVFEPEDAGNDGSVATIDAGATAPADAGSGDATAIVDAGHDHAVPPPPDAARDALRPNTCPGSVPPGAAVCCGAIPCTGTDAKKCNAACTNCEATCNVGQTCCLDKQGALAGCSAVACP